MLPVIPEIFADRSAREGREILHGRGIARRCRDDHAVVHCMVFFESLHHTGNSRTLLPNRDINTKDTLTLLIDDGIDCDGGLPRLAIADDQLTLTAANRDHGINGFDTCL